MLSSVALALLVSTGLFSRVQAQCINNVAVYNPNIRTMTTNLTAFIVPVPKAAVLTAVQEAYPLMNLTLLDVPTSDASLFPNGFPESMHPVLTYITYSDDIRMADLQIDGPLISSSVFATYVSQNGSASPLSVTLDQYIAGENGPLPNGLVPAVASTLLFAGASLRLGQFNPQAASYAGDGAGNFFAESKWAVLPNPVSGPGVYPEAVDLLFTASSASASNYTAKTFKSLLNQPIVLPSGQCQRNTYYFTNATALPVFRQGQVTFGPGSDGDSLTSSALQEASPDGSGVYADNDGFGGCAQVVGNNPENCDVASASVDPVSLT